MTTSYDAYSRPTVKTYANSDYFSSTYDELDNITQIKYNNDNNKQICYYYAADNSLSQVVDYFEGSTARYTYDLSGRIAAVRTYHTTSNVYSASLLANELKYTYEDGTNHLIGIHHYSAQLGSQDISYRYGNLANGEMPDKIYGVSVDGVEKQSFAYDGLGRTENTQVKTTSGVTLNNTYTYEDISGTNKTTTTVRTITNAAGTYTYVYDANGNITTEQFNPVASVRSRIPSYDKTFCYDELDRLTRVNDGQYDVTVIYRYDSRGNMINQEMYDYTEGAINPDEAYSVPYTYSDDSNDRLAAFDGKSCTYDNLGNPLSYKGMTMTWSEGRRLSRTVIPKGGIAGSNWIVDFKYNAGGQRIQKTFDYYGQSTTTTEYIYNGSQLAGQKSSDGKTIIFLYDSNGQYIGLNYNGVEYYYIKNLQGDIIAIADANGTIVGTYTYNAWGEIYYMTGTSSMPVYEFSDNIVAINPIRYRGYYYDAETSLYYLNSRYYDPETCRFINAYNAGVVLDSNLPHWYKNLYSYCDDNPVVRIDIGGDSWQYVWDVIKLALNPGANAAYTAGTEYLVLNKYYVAEFLYQYAFFGKGVELESWQIPDFMIGKLIESNTIREILLPYVTKGEWFDTGDLTSIQMSSKNDPDLFYGIGRFDMRAWGWTVGDQWIINIFVWDDYNFNGIQSYSGFSGASLANDLGYILQWHEVMVPYHWWVRYEYEFQW